MVAQRQSGAVKEDSGHRFIQQDGSAIAAYRYRNPDGSEGGWIALTATIDPSATVSASGFVWPGAIVGPKEVINGHRFAKDS